MKKSENFMTKTYNLLFLLILNDFGCHFVQVYFSCIFLRTQESCVTKLHIVEYVGGGCGAGAGEVTKELWISKAFMLTINFVYL